MPKIAHGGTGHGHPGPTKRVHRPQIAARGLGEVGRPAKRAPRERRQAKTVAVRCPVCRETRDIRGASKGRYPPAADGVLEGTCRACRHDRERGELTAIRMRVLRLRLEGVPVPEIATRLGVTKGKVNAATERCEALRCNRFALGFCEDCAHGLAIAEDRRRQYAGLMEKHGSRMIRYAEPVFEMCVMSDDGYNNFVVGRTPDHDKARAFLAHCGGHVVAASLAT